MWHPFTGRWFVAVVVAAMIAAACSSDPDASPSTTSSPIATVSSTTGPAPTAASSTADPATTTSSATAPSTTDSSTTGSASTASSSTDPSSTNPSSTDPSSTGGPVTLFDEPGPFAVGVTSISLGDRTSEVWYPVDPGKVAGLDKDRYTSLEPLPENIRELLADIDTEIVTDAYRNVPAASDQGPFPVVLYSHGAGGYRKVSAFHTVHLASWGFVVASTDHLERGILAANGFLDLPDDPEADERDLSNTLDALIDQSDNGDGALWNSVDSNQTAVMGHSAGGFAAANVVTLDPRFDTFMSWASGGSVDAELLPRVPSLFVVADGDIAIDPVDSEAFYDLLTNRKRFVVLDNAGHNSFTDACGPIFDRGGLSDVAEALGLPERLLALAEDGCLPDAGFTDPREFQRVLNHLSVAHLFDVFGIQDATAALAPEIVDSFPGLIERYDIG